MTRLYLGLETSGTDKLLGGGRIDAACLSAAILWDRRRACFRRWSRPRVAHLGLDSGGFHRAVREHDFPFTPQDLHGLALRLDAEWVATMDYPCEPGVLRPNREANSNRIERTVARASECLALGGVNWLPVIQGFTESEYLDCISRLESIHAIRGWMGVGTLCARKDLRATRRILQVIRRALPEVRLHGFGVDLRLLKDREIRWLLFSADSQAWHFMSRPLANRYGRTLVGNNEEKIAAFSDYRDRADRVLLDHPRAPLEMFI